jgi:hypothetical protein
LHGDKITNTKEIKKCGNKFGQQKHTHYKQQKQGVLYTMALPLI